ncbi:TetR family transcriptional regulator [Streptomyces sp. ERV7]|uniref:TetR family transcriptional regulator n=1 Tax=Streptomyces sp. ERV7 TaxID=1322334 RepID=UPI0007F5345E|nr:TetR family transcriptional regulator [Streptomyces sp. ERV7]OAR26478.1 TetR family transcriptional regulator [Streptomyces sp. ERV7]
MSTEPLTAERILEATEEVLRRHGPAKATVVDVARQLGVSHGSVYRHFRTKSALREAVTKRWLDRTTRELSSLVADEPKEAEATLRAWLAVLFEAKRRKAGDDPQLFATYEVLLAENSAVVEEHITELVGQLEQIVHRGVERGQFTGFASDGQLARAVFDATNRFHDPAYAPQWLRPEIEADFTALVDLVLHGLRAREA